MASNAIAPQIVVPIDVTGDSTLAIDLARAIARPGDEVTLIHVIPLLNMSGILLPKMISADAIARDIRDDVRRRLASSVDETRMPEGVKVRSIVVDGNPGEEIVNYASLPGAWVVIMETAGEGAAKRMLTAASPIMSRDRHRHRCFWFVIQTRRDRSHRSSSGSSFRSTCRNVLAALFRLQVSLRKD